jgi:hypothetical protein
MVWSKGRAIKGFMRESHLRAQMIKFETRVSAFHYRKAI